MASLYSDRARIRTLRRDPTGAERSMEMAGAQWKALIGALMPVARASNDRSEFTNARVEPAGPLLRIRAERYSVLKCYRDMGYYMLIGRQGDGALTIVEEYSETQPQSSC